MPLFGRKIARTFANNAAADEKNNNKCSVNGNKGSKNSNNRKNGGGGEITSSQKHCLCRDNPREMAVEKPKLIFHCQQAQGSPTGLISGFSNVRQLYEKIAECYDFSPDDILFCTLNTHKPDMTKLLGGQIGLDDFIFAHIKGRRKEIDILKTNESLGLTITDNGNGLPFIKRIREGSIIHGIEHIGVGDHIEKINEDSMVGRRHFEVAKLLKDIPKDTLFTLRLIEPLKAGFSNIEPRSSMKKGKSYGNGRETLRFTVNGTPKIEYEDSTLLLGLEKINQILDSFLGINDNELATQIWELSENKLNSVELIEAMNQSNLKELDFTDDLIIELWGVITDVRAGRLTNKSQIS